jgi:hypothetical protein
MLRLWTHYSFHFHEIIGFCLRGGCMLFFALDEQLCSTNTETIILCTYNPICCNWHGANGVQAYDYVRAVDVWLCGRVGVIEKLGMEWQVWSRAVAGRGRGSCNLHANRGSRRDDRATKEIRGLSRRTDNPKSPKSCWTCDAWSACTPC